MISIDAKKRETKGRKTRALKKQGILPAVLYGPKIKNINLELSLKDFEKIYKEAGASTLISLKMGATKYPVLIYEVKSDPLTGKYEHVDFYQPILTEEVSAMVPLVFIGESLAVKDFGGTLIKEIQEIEVKALPEKLPHEIRVDISVIRNLGDEVLVKDLIIPDGVKIEKNPEDIVVLVTSPEKMEEELVKPAEEEAEKIEEAKKEERLSSSDKEEQNEEKKSE